MDSLEGDGKVKQEHKKKGTEAGERTRKGTRRMVASGLKNLTMEEFELEHSRDGPRRVSMDDRAINNRTSEQRG